MVAPAYERGKALNYAATFAIDDVMDPGDTRRWIAGGLRALPGRLSAPERRFAGSTPGQPDRGAMRAGLGLAAERGER